MMIVVMINVIIYLSSLVGASAVIMGLYIVLWGKAKDLEETRQDTNPKTQNDQTKTVKVLIEEKDSSEKEAFQTDLEEPLLLSQKSSDIC